MKIKATSATLLFCLIFAAAFFLRQSTLWLPHWQGDQSQYIMLAMKLDAGRGISFKDYNLSQINTEVVRIDDPTDTEIIYPYLIQGEKQKGFVLDTYRRHGLESYDMPFFYKAPGLPVALNLSHRLFAGSDKPYAVAKSNLGQKVLTERPGIILKTQFWAAIVPLAANLLLILVVYFWSRRAFGETPALIAAFVLAFNPVSILTAHRVWTEDLGTIFLTLAMFSYRRGFRVSSAPLCLLSGGLMGLSVLTNQRNLLAAGALGLYTVLMLRTASAASNASSKASSSPILKGIWGWSRIFVDWRWWAFASGLGLTTFQWFRTIHRLYGNPFWQPDVFVKMHRGEDILATAGPTNLKAWYSVLLSQPHGAVYYTVGTVAICWVFAAAYLTLKDGLRSGLASAVGRVPDERPLFLWCWVGVFAVYFLTERTGEYRYMYPVYPALAALSGWMIHRLERRLSSIMAHRFLSVGIVVLVLIISAAHSVRTVQPVLWEQKNLINAPWR